MNSRWSRLSGAFLVVFFSTGTTTVFFFLRRRGAFRFSRDFTAVNPGIFRFSRGFPTLSPEPLSVSGPDPLVIAENGIDKDGDADLAEVDEVLTDAVSSPSAACFT